MRLAAVTIMAAATLVAGRAGAQDDPALPGVILSYNAQEATWPHLDMSPDGQEIMFDLLGDIYRMPATGGDAEPVLTGSAWERDAVLSPDGRWMAFISDRSGTTNLWIARKDGSEARQISGDDSLVLYTSPAWSPDSRSIFVSRAVHKVLAFELWRFDLGGGEGELIVEARPQGDEGWDDRVNALGAAVTPDGEAVWYATKRGHTWTEADPPTWSIARLPLGDGGTPEILIPGGMRPVLSPDGTRLAYAARFGAETGLRLRNLETDSDEWLLFPIDRDGQEGGYYYDLLPRYEFTPDGSALILSRGGTFERLDLATRSVTAIPFSAPVNLALNSGTRVVQPVDSGLVRTTLAEGAKPSPDGSRIAFTALGTLYVAGELGDDLHAIYEGDAFAPHWSADGREIIFTRWTAATGGQVLAVPATGGSARPLTSLPAWYRELLAEPDGSILALRSGHYDRMQLETEIAPAPPTDLVRLSPKGDEETVIAHGEGLKNLQRTADGRIWVQSVGALSEVTSTGLRPRISVVATPIGQYVEGTAPVDDILISPNGAWLLARTGWQLHLLPVPPQGEEVATIDLTQPVKGHRQLTRIGADTAGWSADGQAIYWTIGAGYRSVPLATALSTANAEALAQARSLTVFRDRAMPAGRQLLANATVLTMGAAGTIERADILVDGDRIAAIGAAGTLTVPPGTPAYDLNGKYVIPGLIDAHSHLFAMKRGQHDGEDWQLAANLAFGITSVLEVQPFTPDVFAYADRVAIGQTIGPRIFSTGPGIFNNALIDDVATAREVLTRFREAYRTRNIKSYMVGDRAARQAMAQASRELGMMPTTEGAADLALELTHAVDGFAGNEHNLPVTPIHDDIVRLFAATRVAYDPTLAVLYGGSPAVSDDIIHKRPHDDNRLQRFVPPGVIAAKLRNRHWMPAELQSYDRFAADAMRIHRAGGLVGAGSHGEMQGLGLHWEMEAFVAGGATPLEALEIATIRNAEIIGRPDDLGSLEASKLADLVVLDRDPRTDIVNARAITMVMRGGLLFDGETLAPLNHEGQAPHRWWLNDSPTTTGPKS